MIKYSFIKTNATSVFHMLTGFNFNELAQELKNWKDGTRGYVTVHKEGKPKSREQLSYYYAVILPVAWQAFKDNGEIDIEIHVKDKRISLPLSEDNVDLFLKKNYAEFAGEYKDKADMTLTECSAFEDYVIKWLARWLDVHVPPANANWKSEQGGEEERP